MTYIRGDLYGYTKVDPIYNAASGYCLPAGRLIPVQFAKMENGYESNVVATRTSIGAMENTLKENKKGVFYNFKDETGEIHTVYIRDPDKRDKTMPTLSNISFEADKRGAEIYRTLAAENGQTVAPEKKQPKKEMCF